MQRPCKMDNFVEWLPLCAHLDEIDISLNHRLGDAFGICSVDVTQIQDSVEAAIV